MSKDRERARARRIFAQLNPILAQKIRERGQFKQELNCLLKLFTASSKLGQSIMRGNIIEVFKRMKKADVELRDFEDFIEQSKRRWPHAANGLAGLIVIMREIIVPEMAGKTPGNVHRRHALRE